MREKRTIEEQVEQLKQALGCPCTYFPPSKPRFPFEKGDGPVLKAYHQARKRGEQEGFIPMLIVLDEMLMEGFALSGEDKSFAQTRQELLSCPVASGKELLQERLKDAKECLEDCEPEYWEELVGEVSGGDRIDRFLSLRDLDGKQTVPVVLAELPAQNPWEIFAWLPFGAWNACPAPEEHMAIAKYWFEAHGAVPALMSSDVLEYSLPAPVPRENAMDTALEQYAYCNDIVDQGVGTIGRLADGLAKSTVWYFWWD